MKKHLIALFVFIVFAFPSFADEKDQSDVELNAFGFPDKSLVTIIESAKIKSIAPVGEKPKCDDPNLINLVREKSKPYLFLDSSTIYNRRRNILIIKNIGNFTDLSIDEARNLETNILKARLVELKINNNLGDENIKLCKGNNPILDDQMYLLMYDNNSNVKVELLNMRTRENPTFYFHNK